MTANIFGLNILLILNKYSLEAEKTLMQDRATLCMKRTIFLAANLQTENFIK